jgi:hypothetical protein
MQPRSYKHTNPQARRTAQVYKASVSPSHTPNLGYARTPGRARLLGHISLCVPKLHLQPVDEHTEKDISIALLNETYAPYIYTIL